MTQHDFQNKKPLQIFLSYYKPHVNLFIADLFCATIMAIVDTSFPILSKITLDSLIPTGELSKLIKMIVFMIVIFIIRSVANWFVNYWGHTFGTLVEMDMRKDLFTHIENQDFTFFDNNRTGKIMSRVTTDLFEVTELAHHGPEDIFISVLTILGSFVLLLKIRWELALIVILYVPILIFVTIRSRKSLTKTSRSVKEQTAEINSVLESSISGVRVTKAFANEGYEIDRFQVGNKNFKNAKSRFYKAMSFFHSRLDLSMNLLNVLVLAVGGYFIMQNKMQLSDLVAANLFIATFFQPIRRLTNFVEQYTTGMAGFNRFLELMQQKQTITESKNAIELSNVKGNIEFNNVCFSYTNSEGASDNQNLVLNHINLSIPAGQTLAVVGPSGTGKTTLCHLLPRFYDANSGEILIDSKSIKDVTLKSLRQNIGIVQQDVFLFAGTIKENIAYGNIFATDEQILEAAQKAEIHEDILKMPNQYDTVVGERGVKLSGGQKQRIAIARIFLKNPPILILDEATSALDTATEHKIQSAFTELAKGRTTLIIAHRLSTIKSADNIIVIDDEKIVEQGTHEQLLQQNGIYKNLYDR